MFLKNYIPRYLDAEATEALGQNLFADPEIAQEIFDTSQPEAIEKEAEKIHTSGFVHPGQLAIELATDLESTPAQSFYGLVHVSREKVVDAQGIRDRCYEEFADSHGMIEIEQIAEKRILVARELAPIKEVKTPLYISGDGAMVIGAVGIAAVRVANDVIRLLCSQCNEEGEIEGVGNHEPYKARFRTINFHRRCVSILDDDVWGVGDLGEEGLPADLVEFGGDFKVKLRDQDKAELTVKHCGMLPEELRPFLQSAEYTAFSLKVSTGEMKYDLTINPKGEVKGFGVSDDYDAGEFDVLNGYLCMCEMFRVYSILVGLFAVVDEEEE